MEPPDGAVQPQPWQVPSQTPWDQQPINLQVLIVLPGNMPRGSDAGIWGMARTGGCGVESLRVQPHVPKH